MGFCGAAIRTSRFCRCRHPEKLLRFRACSTLLRGQPGRASDRRLTRHTLEKTILSNSVAASRWADQMEERLAAGDKWQDNGLVFTTTLGTPLDPRNALRHFSRVLKAAEIPHIRFHDLRHSC